MEVIWSEEVLQNYFRVLDYLLEKWSVREIENFENRFDDLILDYKGTKKFVLNQYFLHYRKCLIDKNNSLIYQEITNKIFLVAIIDNKSSHQY